jgi:hypothetical protein
MSNVRIALVAEGPLDLIVIQSILRAIVPCPFILTLLQPEATRPKMGNGWAGVLKWCHAAHLRHLGSLDTDPTLVGFDLLIIHVDADVADMRYVDCGQEIVNLAAQFGWHTLPSSLPCPPSGDSCNQVRLAISSWLGNATPGQKTVFCIPSKSIGTWLAAAALPANHALLTNAECNLGLERSLSQLPLAQRIRKGQRDYRLHEATILNNWGRVTIACSQALAFQQSVQQIAVPACEQNVG